MNESPRTLLPLIPKPVVVNQTVGLHIVDDDVAIFAERQFDKMAKYLQEIFTEHFKIKTTITNARKSRQQILLERNDDPYLPEDGYVINNVSNVIHISSPTPQGIFYGIQTLRQLMSEEDGSWVLPKVIIRDYPRFSWRGFMLDEARHFMGKDVVKRLLEVMAFLKLNKFHWHLVDDQGWRIEIKRYPKLVEIGSRRKVVRKRGEQPLEGEPEVYGGHYSQEDIQEIVAFGQERFIDIIPEIEIPGHSSAAIAAYPKLSCKKTQSRVPIRWGIFKNIYCAGEKETYTFLENVLQEIMSLFPAKQVHIGGDEVLTANWKNCPACQKKIQEEGLEGVDDLQPFMTNYFAKFLKKNDRQLMGWSQIIHPKIPGDVLCQHWFGNKEEVMKFLRRGGKVVSSEMLSTYLDYPYALISLKKAYEFDPVPAKLEEEYVTNILGIEAPLWTERVPNQKRLYYQVFPRLLAYAETAWTPEAQKNYKRFLKRLPAIMEKLEKLGVKVDYL
ncbi:MAG: beta-N-acetylhexosaminidase [Candidatus Heimdallarchaeota archaeon]